MLQKIIQALQRKDKQSEAHRLIYDMFYEKIYYTVYFVTKDSHITDDVVQETFIKALSKLDTVKDLEKIGGWLRTIAMNTTINYYRTLNKVQHVEFDEAYINDYIDIQQIRSAEDTIELSILKEQIILKIAHLPYIYREVLALKFIAEFSDAEIAKALELNIGTVKSRIHRAKQKLFIDMQNDPEYIGGEMIEV